MSKEMQVAALRAAVSDKDATPEERALARAWLKHYPDTSPGNVLGRLNARDKNRAKAKRAKASRKANRRAK